MVAQLSDNAAERAVLAGLWKYGNDAYLDIADILQVETFTDKANQALFSCFFEMFETRNMEKADKASLFTVARDLNYEWLWEQSNELEHVRSIMNTGIHMENVRRWAGKIRKLHVARLMNEQLGVAKHELMEVKGDETFDHIVGIVENRIFDFTMLLQGNFEEARPTQLGNGMAEYVQYLKDNPVEMVGISSGYTLFDQSIGGGFRPKTVSIIGARTGMGKGQLGINITLHVAGKAGIPVLYLDTEMGLEDHWNRTLANKSGVDINLIETGKFGKSSSDVRKMEGAVETLKDIPYTYVDVAGRPFEEMISVMRRWLHKSVGFDDNGNVKPCLIIYDYLKLMSSEGITANLAEYQMLGFQMTGLHNFACRHRVPILSFIQLNRDGIDKETTATASGSDRIVWLASNLSIFKPKTDEEIDMDGGIANGNRKLLPLKCRHGAGMPANDYICMRLTGELSRVEEIDTHSNMVKQRNSGSSTGNNASMIEDNDGGEVPMNENDDVFDGEFLSE